MLRCWSVDSTELWILAYHYSILYTINNKVMAFQTKFLPEMSLSVITTNQNPTEGGKINGDHIFLLGGCVALGF